MVVELNLVGTGGSVDRQTDRHLVNGPTYMRGTVRADIRVLW